MPNGRTAPHSPWPKKFINWNQDIVDNLFFHIQGIVYYEFVPPWQKLPPYKWQKLTKCTVWECCKGCMKNEMQTPKHFANSLWLIHHNNALAQEQITLVFWPDLVPSASLLYLKIKEVLKGKHFDDTEDIKANMTTFVKTVPEKEFPNCFKGLSDFSVYLPKESTLKVTMVVFSIRYGANDEFMNLIIRPHIYSVWLPLRGMISCIS